MQVLRGWRLLLLRGWWLLTVATVVTAVLSATGRLCTGLVVAVGSAIAAAVADRVERPCGG